MLKPLKQLEGGPFTTRMARLRRLETALETALFSSPNSAQAWHWRVQIKVLRFIVSRYGDAPEEVTTPPRNRPLPDFELPNPPQAPMPLPKMRRILGKVHQINESKPVEISTHQAEGKTFWLLDPDHSTFARLLLTDLGAGRANLRLPRWMRVLSFLMHYTPHAVMVLFCFSAAIGFILLLLSYATP